MTQEDQFYRAFGDFLRTARENRYIVSDVNAIANAAEGDKITVTHNVCHVEEDWVAAIERGLVFIGKAIEEDRQFIRSNGEVQPIEKVRHISRESVQHLSRHSDMITREQKENDIIPDKLYTVERLNDYAVYENRFLYVLLLRIRDFISVRYDAIMRAYRLYRGELQSKKSISTGTRRFSYQFTFIDEQDDIFSAAADKECASYLDRIEKIRQSVAFFLRTPLMLEVARVDKIKKLTKTNVLRMDKNFREAVVLYEFLLNYEKAGYEIESHLDTFDPVSPEVAKELALSVLLSAFLVYEHGLGLEAFLQAEYEKEEAHREELRQLALVEQIKELKKRIEATGEGMEQYMLLLEERNAALEADSKELVKAKEEIEKLNGDIDTLHAEAEVMQEEIADLTAANEKWEEDFKRAEEEHREQMETLRREHAEEIASLNSAHETELSNLKTAHENELANLRESHSQAMRRAEQSHREECNRIRRELEAKIEESRNQFAEKANELTSTQKELTSVDNERQMLLARLTALRSEYGLLNEADDFTTEEGFNALEHEFEVLGRLVREKWTDVKRILRKEFYNGIRTTMRGKKGQKSKEYLQLSAEAKARRGETEETVPEAEAPDAAAETQETQAAEEQSAIAEGETQSEESEEAVSEEAVADEAEKAPTDKEQGADGETIG